MRSTREQTDEYRARKDVWKIVFFGRKLLSFSFRIGRMTEVGWSNWLKKLQERLDVGFPSGREAQLAQSLFFTGEGRRDQVELWFPSERKLGWVWISAWEKSKVVGAWIFTRERKVTRISTANWIGSGVVRSNNDGKWMLALRLELQSPELGFQSSGERCCWLWYHEDWINCYLHT